MYQSRCILNKTVGAYTISGCSVMRLAIGDVRNRDSGTQDWR